jgi:hypothetical protein
VPKFFRWVTVIWFVGWRVASEGYNFRVHERPMECIEGSKLIRKGRVKMEYSEVSTAYLLQQFCRDRYRVPLSPSVPSIPD